MMELIDKANILAEIYPMSNDDAWEGFFINNQEAITISHFVSIGDILSLSAHAENLVNVAYDNLLQESDADNIDYSSLNEILMGVGYDDA